MSCTKYCFSLLISSSFLVLITAEDFQETLRKEIEAVATESKHLADELADVLLGMEVEDLKEKTGSGDQQNKNIESAIDAMETRIKKLEGNLKYDTKESFEEGNINDSKKVVRISKGEALRQPLEKLEMIVKEIKGIALSDDSEGDFMKIIKDMNRRISELEEKNIKDYAVETSNKSVKSQELTLIKEFPSKEESLRGALNKFKNISRDLNNLNSPQDLTVESENRFGKVIKAMATKLSLDEMKISIDLAFGKGKKMKIVKNDFETMIESLMGVAESLNRDEISEEDVGVNQDGDQEEEEYEDDKQENKKHEDKENADFEDDEYENEEVEDENYHQNNDD